LMEPELVEQIKAAGRAWIEAQAKAQSGEGKPWMAEVWESYQAYQDTWASNAFTRTWDVE